MKRFFQIMPAVVLLAGCNSVNDSYDSPAKEPNLPNKSEKFETFANLNSRSPELTKSFNNVIADEALARQDFGQVVLAINSGGGELISSSGIYYQADDYFSESSLPQYNSDIVSKFEQLELYQFQRSALNGESLSYGIPLKNGNYNVILKTNGAFVNASDKVLDNILLENQAAEIDHQVFSKLESENLMVNEGFDLVFFNVAINDGSLDLQLEPTGESGLGTNLGAIIITQATSFDNLSDSSRKKRIYTSTAALQKSKNNKPPLVNTGHDIDVEPGHAVTIRAKVKDPDGKNKELKLKWQQLSGTPIEIKNSGAAKLYFNAPTKPGQIVLELTATDPKGAKTSDSVTISVAKAGSGKTPILSIPKPATVKIGNKFSFKVVANDPDGDNAKIKYSWKQSSGPTAKILNGSSNILQAQAPNIDLKASMVFIVTATDTQGLRDEGKVVINVINDPNSPPTVDVGPDVIAQPYSLVQLTGRATDAEDGSNLLYFWKQLSGPVGTFSNRKNRYSTFRLPKGINSGEIVLRLEAKDSKGALGFDQMKISISESIPQPPVLVVASNLKAKSKERFRLNAAVKGDASGIKFNWRQTSGPKVKLRRAKTAKANFKAPNKPANLTFVVSATNSDGLSSSAKVLVEVVK